MLCGTWIHKLISLGLTLSILNVCTAVSIAAPPEIEPTTLMGAISVTGEVRVNGATTFSGGTIFPGSTIETGPASSAVIRLNAGAGVELLPNSVLRLSFDDKSVNGSLDRGQTRFSTTTGIRASVQTGDGVVLSHDAQPSQFFVSIECGNTTVDAQQGNVELRAEDAQRIVAAGHRDSIGSPAAGCLPLKDDDDDGLSDRAVAAIITGGVAAILITIIVVNRDDDNVVSPVK
jgi:phage baseplate assembly protein gpV